MADELDPEVAAAYRALGAEEPPRALDEAILAASRRPPKALQRWAVPLSLAAVLVLSVTVTLRIQQEAPELQSIAPPPAAAPQQEKEQVAPLKLKAETQIKTARPAARAEPKAFGELRRDQAPAAAASASATPALPRLENDSMRPESSVSGPAARQAEERLSRDAEAAARTPQAGAALAKRSMAAADAAPPAAPSAAPAPPLERELERIAALRLEGRHDEADKALAEFRRRHPEFRIPEDWLKRVERR